MPPLRHEAEVVDLLVDAHASYSRGDLTAAVDRFLRAGRKLDADKRDARRAAVAPDDLAMIEDHRDALKRERINAALAMYRADLRIEVAVFPGFSKLVAVFGAWTDEYQDAAEQLFVSQCDPIRPDGCWVWRGAVNYKREPVVSIGGAPNMPARVFSYRLFLGALPRGREVVQTCTTPDCVSVEHVALMPRKRRYTAEDYYTKGDL